MTVSSPLARARTALFAALAVGTSLGMVLAASTAAAAPPGVGGLAFETCGSWKNKMRNFGGYKIGNYNRLVPPNLAVDASEAIPAAVWEFYDDGISRGFDTDEAFLGILGIVDETGLSRPQTVMGTWRQKGKKVDMQVDPRTLPDAFADAASVSTTDDSLTTTRPHGFPDMFGPVRFVTGRLPDDELGELPSPLDEFTDYYINYLSATSLSVSLEPGGPVVDLTTTGDGRHTIHVVGAALPNTFQLLSELFLFGEREVIGVLDFVTVDNIKLKAKIDKKATAFKVKLSGKSNYDIDTDDVVGRDFDGNLSYKASSSSCPAP